MKHTKKIFIISLLVMACIGFVTCSNPFMETWWDKDDIVNPDPFPTEPQALPVFHKVTFDAKGGTPEP